MSKKRKLSVGETGAGQTQIKVEVKEEEEEDLDGGQWGGEVTVLCARGRLRGALQELLEHSGDEEGEGATSGEEDGGRRQYHRRTPPRRQRRSDQPQLSTGSPSSSPYHQHHHTYVMKLFDRSVDLARFEEDTPLYPICRAWMANQPRGGATGGGGPVIKRRSSPSPDRLGSVALWNGDRLREVHRLPPPAGAPVCRVPLYAEPRDVVQRIDLDYEKNPPVAREQLIKDHLQRWTAVKRKWIQQANNNEERFTASFQILQTIYNKAQEGME